MVVGGELIIDVSLMNKVVEVDLEMMILIVEFGIILENV